VVCVRVVRMLGVLWVWQMLRRQSECGGCMGALAGGGVCGDGDSDSDGDGGCAHSWAAVRAAGGRRRAREGVCSSWVRGRFAGDAQTAVERVGRERARAATRRRQGRQRQRRRQGRRQRERRQQRQRSGRRKAGEAEADEAAGGGGGRGSRSRGRLRLRCGG
jgi:hypothetical protein